jgi:hypothetical protein
MELPTREVLLEAARRAQLLYPGPVGDLLQQELISWLQFGHLLGSALILRVAHELVRGPTRRTPRTRLRHPGGDPVVGELVDRQHHCLPGDRGAAM